MNICVLGFRDPQLSIVDRLINGFQELGHTCNLEDSPDFVIAMDHDRFEEAQKYDCFKIYNLLDVPLHVFGPKQIAKVSKQLKGADFITSISQTTADDVRKYYGYVSEVVYAPILPEIKKNTQSKKTVGFLYVGRIGDWNKRADLMFRALQFEPELLSVLLVCGSERPILGNSTGVVENHKLVELYNQSIFLFLPSKREGIGLPMIEAAICGCIPITCLDNPTAKEFGLEVFSCEPTPQAIYHMIKKIERNMDFYKQMLEKVVRDYRYMEKFSAKNVAQRYIDIYERNKR